MAEQGRDVVLAPGTYAYVQDTTKGHVSIYTGPASVTPTAGDQLVIWTGKKFASVEINQAIQPFVKANESQYVVLTDPAEQNPETHPPLNTKTVAADLDSGKKIVIPGPTTFALWPGQSAEVIDGHHLSYNEYLVVQVYEPQAAQANADRTIAEPQGDEKKAEKATKARRFTMGERQVIKGTDVSYYVPPTGIEVVQEDGEAQDAASNKARRPGAFVREAATLEQLEYCVLVDESGKKRYERGPAVVFPQPTERFITEKGDRKFRAIELNAQSGLYIKVVSDYTHEDDFTLAVWRGDGMIEVKKGDHVKEGDELFLTGSVQSIYYPRAEHSVIQYGVKRKHHAVAIPTGEGRYVLDRTSGKVNLVRGPMMFLPDPRTEVVVRRVLDLDDVAVMYPSNTEAMQVNTLWRQEMAGSEDKFLEALGASASVAEAGSLSRSYQSTKEFGGEKMRRSTEYTPPRTITLDTKYQGAVTVSVWPSYAILVMDKSGNRRVEVGPQTILLNYDESLMQFALSTGRPKNTDHLYPDVYLRIINNQVGDLIHVETKDLVPLTLKLSYRVNFEGEGDEQLKWFAIENYVKLLTDHCRSRLRNAAKRLDVQDFYSNAIDIVRNTVLGDKATDKPREGRHFPDNNMRLVDVEVLGVDIDHPQTQALLEGATRQALEGAIQVTQARERADRTKELEGYRRQTIDEEMITASKQAEAVLATLERDLDAELKARQVADVRRDENAAIFEQNRVQREQLDTMEVARQREEAQILVERMRSIDPTLITAIQNFGDQRFVEQIITAVGPAAMAAGVSSADVLHQQLKDTPWGAITKTLVDRPFATAFRNGGES